MVLIIVFFAGAFFVGTGFLTTVVLLESLFSLIVLARPFPIVGADAAGAATLLPLPAPEALLSAVTFRVTLALVVFAFSTIFVSNPEAPPDGTDGFRGETGLARYDFCGDAGRATGDLGSVRELADRGDRTCDGAIFAR